MQNDPAGALLQAIGHHEAGRPAEAQAICEAVLAADPDHPRASYLLGILLLAHDDPGAARVLGRAARLAPGHLGARINRLRALLRSGKPAQAAAEATEAVALWPAEAELHFLRGTAFNALSRPEEAVAAFASALALAPRHPAAWLNLGNACADLDRLEEAERHCRTAIRLAPDLVAAHASLGFALTSLGRLEEAILACAEAIRLAPDFAVAHWNLATAALLAGDFETGFREYEWRKRHDRFRQDFVDLPGPVWDGAPPAGRTVLVHAEQGFGDTIQLARYLPLIAARGARVVLACDRPLVRLLGTIPGIAEVIPKDATLPAYDLWIDQMSLPHVFRTGPGTIPSPHGYLIADPERRAAWDALLPPDRPRVGLVWAGNPMHFNDRRRSLPKAALQRLCAMRDVRFVSLQVGARASEAAGLPVAAVSAHATDYFETAAALAELDLLITVDTSVAHLAGALGRPAWVMLPFAPDWRWILGRADTPWYHSLRLFRQDAPGDWDSVLARIEAALAAWVQPRS